MAWQALWRKEHHVDPYVVARAGKARAQHFGRRGDAAQAILVDVPDVANRRGCEPREIPVRVAAD